MSTSRSTVCIMDFARFMSPSLTYFKIDFARLTSPSLTDFNSDSCIILCITVKNEVFHNTPGELHNHSYEKGQRHFLITVHVYAAPQGVYGTPHFLQ